MLLPLTSIEEFFLWLDQPAFPFHIFVRLRFDGVLDRAALETAARTALARHPLLRAKVECGNRNELRWVVMDDFPLLVRWTTGVERDEFPAAEAINLFENIGIRFHIVSSHSESHLIIQVHHACCDAVGLFQFVNDLLISYARARDSGQLAIELPLLDPIGLTLRKHVSPRPVIIAALLNAVRVFSRKPQTLVPFEQNNDETEQPSGFPQVLTRVLSRDETSELRARVDREKQRSGVTLNDLLVSAVFLAVREWREKTGLSAADRSWLRVIVPKNLRNAESESLPAANAVSLLIFDRRCCDVIDPARLQRSIRAEMNRNARLRLWTPFLFFLRACRCLAGGIKQYARSCATPATSVLSNLGRVLKKCALPRRQDSCLIAGNVVLRHAEFAVPYRRGLCATFGVTDYAERLHVTLHFDPRVLSATQARELLELFVQQTHASALGSEDEV